MNTGKLVRLNRIFSHPSGRLCSVAVDHFLGYSLGMPPGLRHMAKTLAAIASARPDAVTMQKGFAASAWQPYAGRIPLILQSTAARPDDTARQQIADPEDAVRLGADGFAVAAFVRGATEADYVRCVADCVRQAVRFEMPVICHVYPRCQGEYNLHARRHCLGGSLRGGSGRGRGKDAVLRRRGELRADRRRLPGAAGRRGRAEGRHASCGAGDGRGGGAKRRPRGRHRQEHLGLEKIAAAVHAFKAVIHDGKSADEALRQMET